MPSDEYAELGRRAAVISAWGNMAISLMKMIVGSLSGSIGLFTDGLHSLIDVISSVLVWVGIKISIRPPDKMHPYGHYKAENIVSLFVAIFIVGAGVETAWESIKKLISPEGVLVTPIVLVVPVVSAAVSFALAEYKGRIGKRINSPSLIAEGVHSRVDTLASVAVFLGLLFVSYGFLIADPMIGVLISFAIVWEGCRIGKDSICTLMDALLEPSIIDRIRRVAEGVPGVMKVADVRARSAGSHILVDMEIELSPTLDITRADVIRREVVEKIKREISSVDHVFVAIRPVRREEIIVAIPCKGAEGLKAEVCDHFGRAEFIAIVTLGAEGDIKEVVIERNPFFEEERGKGVSLAEALFKKGVTVVVSRNIGKAAFSMLQSYGISILRASGERTVEEVLKSFCEGKLEEQRKPFGVHEDRAH